MSASGPSGPLVLLVYYNQANTKLAFLSNETFKDKLSIIQNWLSIIVIQVHANLPNYTKNCSFLHAHYTET